MAFIPKTVLCVAAHPDDLEFGAAGSVAKWVSQEAEVYYLILTTGNKGTEDRSLTPDYLQDIRRKEQRAAADILGVSEVYFLDYEDGALEVAQNVKADIAKIIRMVRPDTVVTMDPSMLYQVERGFINHPDHRAAGQNTLDAVFPLARDHLSFPELIEAGLEPHKVQTLLLINFNNTNYGIDISSTFGLKTEALLAHTSQISDPDSAIALIRDMAVTAGVANGYKLAETFLKIDIR